MFVRVLLVGGPFEIHAVPPARRETVQQFALCVHHKHFHRQGLMPDVNTGTCRHLQHEQRPYSAHLATSCGRHTEYHLRSLRADHQARRTQHMKRTR